MTSWIEKPDPGRPEPVVEYYDDGITVRTVTYHTPLGQRSRIGGPAFISYFENGLKRTEIWMQNGLVCRDNGPAVIHWDENGNPTDMTHLYS